MNGYENTVLFMSVAAAACAARMIPASIVPAVLFGIAVGGFTIVFSSYVLEIEPENYADNT